MFTVNSPGSCRFSVISSNVMLTVGGGCTTVFAPTEKIFIHILWYSIDTFSVLCTWLIPLTDINIDSMYYKCRRTGLANILMSTYINWLINLPSIQKLLLGEKSDTPCSLITANEMLTSLQINSLRSSSVSSKFLWNNHKFNTIIIGS